ncbi:MULTISPECIES: ABC transporter ATP-binding protein [Lentzea]|uniref:NitT/TauT family transport system ATP-binding protein n=2 Tax=Lentzea TaxID=165301 RepID=A0A1H9FNI4_9PSEU|nr:MULTISPECIES: ABC transporter ATP-binding protein [Lentzea]MDX8147878.1 ABC transporter ATP-binding protein [Lentzea sp. BCCO 10_0061]RDI35148.1 NitT/TauT family transport system ATP-binding protein [Lentzea flaviverrucosa]SEQ39456.1 NitT/TauT family transport system ATP-binding protein [Lentzea flaviverrucosa]
MISLTGVSHSFGGVHALDGIDLEVGEHEFVAVIGRSGCGKSTLLRLVAGLLTAARGRILVAGSPVTRPRRDVSVMFQRPALLPWRTVLANVLLPTEIFGLGDQRDRAHELLELAGLGGFEKRLPHELSGGMQQRVSLCRSLIQSPRVMLMDEPFSALDAITRTELSEELQRVQLARPRAVVFVTHSIDEAVLLADRIVVLSPRPGRIHRIVDVGLPRPRALGQVELDEVSRELRGLLVTA